MNPREKLLAGCVVSIMILGGSWIVVKWGVVDRWQDLYDDIAKQTEREERLRELIALASTAEERWGALKPLAHNPDYAMQRFQDDINRIVGQHGLSGPKFSLKPLRVPGRKSGFPEVRLKIAAHGTLKRVVGFMCDLYRREYLVRLDQLSLTAEDQQGGGRTARSKSRRSRSSRSRTVRSTSGSSDRDGPQLSVSMTVTALVLPEITRGRETIPQDAIADPAPQPESLGRLPREPAEYDVVWEQNIFKLWQKPTTVVRRTEDNDTQEEEEDDEVEEVTTRTEPRPDKVLLGVECSAGQPSAFVREEGRRELPPERVRLNDPVDDGTLVLVYLPHASYPRHKGGMVVQVATEDGDAFEYKYYMYWLGASFSQREELDPAQYPDIQAQLNLWLVP